MDEYKVVRTNCTCHPETCCCDDWTITKNGEKFTTCYLKATAEQIAKALNFYEENQND